MRANARTRQVLSDLLAAQKLAVLATQGDGKPYASLVAFAVTEDLRHMLFTTSRETRKYANLASNPSVALLIDNRSNTEADFEEAMAVTVIGKAKDAGPRERKRLLDVFLAKHPKLEKFASAPTTALIKVTVDKFIIISTFENVVEFRPK